MRKKLGQLIFFIFDINFLSIEFFDFLIIFLNIVYLDWSYKSHLFYQKIANF